MEITQKYASYKIRFAFHDDRLDHAWKDSSRSRSFSVPYTEISRDRQTFMERQYGFKAAKAHWDQIVERCIK